MLRPIFLTRWLPAIWMLLFAVLTAVLAASRVDHPAMTWRSAVDLGDAAALSEPALFAEPPAVIWRSETGLLYQPLDEHRAPSEILRYADVSPRRWQAAPAARDHFHVVWLEDNNRLRSALLSTSGDTLRGPILLASGIRPNFVTLPTADDSLVVVWLNERADEMNTVTIDSAGRPGPIHNILVGRVFQIAAARDEANNIHLAWLTAPSPDTWAIHYQVSGAAALNINSAVVLHTFTLAPGESITGFGLGLDSTHGYIVLSTSGAEQPDIERVQVLDFRLDSPAGASLAEVHLPFAALRWPQPAPGQHSVMRLAVQLRTPDGWQPAVISFQNGALAAVDRITMPAGPGPLALVAASSGALYLAWTGLSLAEPHLYVSSTTDSRLSATSKSSRLVLRQTLGGAGIGIALTAVWLILPGSLLWLTPDRAQTLPLALAMYSAAKLSWPADLLSRLPPWMAVWELDQYISPPWLVGITLCFIALAAGGTWYWARGRAPRSFLGTYLFVDALLTWLVFGANVLI